MTKRQGLVVLTITFSSINAFLSSRQHRLTLKVPFFF
ncbi:hypothetical protein TcasGA2_TC033218 [Tribolium castaneum]|uniref:Uncharacterized protein n=1 Tax=Tribolium castaneum TaxID=7070 RepID=A0A139WHI8_TRICA|nr:hypothetical protein TcasGA2_TC033218 [Tribolium castaneum]